MAGTLSGQVVLASATERLALAGTTTVSTFTDSDLSELSGAFTATIDWGDGTTSAATIVGSNGSFSVQGGHDYADEGNFALIATVTRTVGGATIADTGNVAVAEHDVLAAQGTSITGDTNQALAVQVATFTDTDTAAVAGDFTAIVDWGDGTTTTGTITGSSGSFAVNGSHTYTFGGQDTITVTVVDPAPGTANAVAIGTANIGVSAEVTLTSATERVALAPTTVVASVTDGNLTDTAVGFTAQIDWGDGTTTTGTVVGSNGSFVIEGGHTYADEGIFTVSTSLTRTSDSTVVVSTSDVAVLEHDVLAAQGQTISGDTTLTNVQVATFTDTDTVAVVGDFIAAIDWGDGTTTAGTITGSNGSFAVNGDHTYAASGQDTITVTVSDPIFGTANATATSTATVGLFGLESLHSATERVALAASTVVAHITDGNHTDAASGFTATINWGDGSTSPGTIVGGAGSFSVEGGHTYADEGNFALTTIVTRTSDNTVATSTGSVAVAEHDVLAAQGTTLISAAGQALANVQVATFTDADTAASTSNFVASINWGDGSTSPGTISGSNGSFAVNGGHTYAASGQDTITVTVSDPSPGTAIATADSFRFDHINQAPVNTVPGPQNTLIHTDLALAGFSVADPGASSLTTALHVDHGELTLLGTGGANVSGSGGSTVTLTGSVAQVDAALGAANNLVYTSHYGFTGTDTLTMTSTDGTGFGAAQTDTDTVAIHVSPSSLAPPQFAGFELLF
jgi:hypothetical protein